MNLVINAQKERVFYYYYEFSQPTKMSFLNPEGIIFLELDILN